MPNQFANLLSPGVYVKENTAGYRVQELASHTANYMVGSASTGALNDATQVVSLADFKNQFGSSLSESSVKAFFRNDPTGILYFIRCGIADRFTLTIGSVTAGTVTITVNGDPSTITITGSDTVATVRSAIIAAVNLNTGAEVTAVASPSNVNAVNILSDSETTPLTVTVTGAGITATETTGTLPSAVDYVRAIESFSSYDDELPQGFIFAPEAFANLSNETDRLTVGNALETLASREGYDWVALIDCGAGLDTVAEYSSDGLLYTTSKGHAAYFAPYGIDLEGDTVPMSALVAANASVKYKALGFQEPIGGAVYQLKGLQGLTQYFNRQQQDVLNPLGVNLVRNLRNKGICLWGMRTRSDDALYRFINTRVIMNVLNGTLRQAFDQFLFSSIDGRGVLLHRIEETAISVCRRMYRGGAFFGATEPDAFAVQCNFENNFADDLETGSVYLAVYAAPAPGLERLLVGTFRVGLGQVQASRQAALVVSG